MQNRPTRGNVNDVNRTGGQRTAGYSGVVHCMNDNSDRFHLTVLVTVYSSGLQPAGSCVTNEIKIHVWRKEKTCIAIFSFTMMVNGEEKSQVK